MYMEKISIFQKVTYFIIEKGVNIFNKLQVTNSGGYISSDGGSPVTDRGNSINTVYGKKLLLSQRYYNYEK